MMTESGGNWQAAGLFQFLTQELQDSAAKWMEMRKWDKMKFQGAEGSDEKAKNEFEEALKELRVLVKEGVYEEEAVAKGEEFVRGYFKFLNQEIKDISKKWQGLTEEQLFGTVEVPGTDLFPSYYDQMRSN